MNSLRASLAWLLLAGSSAMAQGQVQPAPFVADTVPLTSFAGARRTPAELEQLLAPIALYPDALIALILPASTASTDVVLAARHVREAGPDSSQVEHRAWDESVKSLTHYPDLLKWMDENLQWTKQVGEAFAEQPVDVMQAIQRLRAQARAAGTLTDTPQQQVLTDLEVIRIVPAQPETIYVPYYEPTMMFVREPFGYGRPFLTFGLGLPVGAWLAYDFDWRRHTIWVGNRHRPWTGHDWRRPVVPIPIVAPAYARHSEVRPWRPPPAPTRFANPGPYRPANAIVGSAPVAPLASRTFAPSVPSPRPPGFVSRPRREVPPPVPANSPQVTSTTMFAPQVVTAPLGPGPAGPVATTTATTIPAVSARKGPPDRQPNQGTPTYTHQRHAPPAPQANPSVSPAATVAPAVRSPRPSPATGSSYSRPAPPAAASTAQPSSPPRAQPQPPPAPTAAPVTTNSTTRTEPDHSSGRRNPNER